MEREYTEKLLIEGVTVGGLVVIVNRAIKIMLPKATPAVRLFLTGVAIHFGCEFSGINEWYLTHSASALKHGHHDEGELFSSVTSESKCQFMDMSSCQHSGLEERSGSMQEGFVRILRK